MNQNDENKDLPIEYSRQNEQTAPTEPTSEINFSPLFLGCPKPIKHSWWIVFAIVIGVYFVSTLFIGNIVLLPMHVEGSSMYPTLNITYETDSNKYAQDVVYLWKTQDVSYGDVIVFKANPYEESFNGYSTDVYFIKRVIATAGDTLQFKKVSGSGENYLAEYVLYKNGELLNEPYIAATMLFNTLNEKYSAIINEEVITVPQGTVYVMGDNRNNSKDSREIGVIKTTDIVGNVVLHIPYGRTVIYGIYNSIKQGFLF